MNVQDIMTRDPFTIGPDTSVADVVRALLSQGSRGVPVVDPSGRYLGLITERDVVTKQARVHLPVYIGLLGLVAPIELPHSHDEVQHALAVNAEQLMEPDAVSVGPDATVEDVSTLMVEEDADAVPVLEGERVIGMVNRLDIIRLLALEESDVTPAGDS